MKPQDLFFFTILTAITLYKKGNYLWHTGIILLLTSGVLFIVGNLFTSQRVAWYGAAFIFGSILKYTLYDK